MLRDTNAFTANDIPRAKEFYGRTLGLKFREGESPSRLRCCWQRDRDSRALGRVSQILNVCRTSVRVMFVGKANVRTVRFDPYKNFKFRVKLEDRYVAGFTKAGGLECRIGPKSPFQSKYEAITLERGVTRDKEFQQWASNKDMSLKDSRRDIILEVYNEAGQLAFAYKIYRCWVSEFQAIPDLDASASTVDIQHLKLENEGLGRDPA